MRYFNGKEARVGDLIALTVGGPKGVIVADLERRVFTPECPENEWGYLRNGLLVHMEGSQIVLINELDEDAYLIKRKCG